MMRAAVLAATTAAVGASSDVGGGGGVGNANVQLKLIRTCLFRLRIPVSLGQINSSFAAPKLNPVGSVQ